MRTHGHRSRDRAGTARRGFSLLELIVVIALLAVLGAAAVGTTSSTLRTRQRSAAQLLAGDLRYCRQRALATGRSTWAVFTLGSSTVLYSETISGVTTAIAAPGTGRQLGTRLDAASDGGWYNGVKLGTFNGAATSPVTIGFDWRGRPVNNAGTPLTTAQTVTITAPGATAITLTLQPETAAVSITW
jgi:prepilin-type N-terminal cleavage/methylation domain-containing protein